MDGNGVTGGEYREEVCTLQFAEFEEQHSGYWYDKYETRKYRTAREHFYSYFAPNAGR